MKLSSVDINSVFSGIPLSGLILKEQEKNALESAYKRISFVTLARFTILKTEIIQCTPKIEAKHYPLMKPFPVSKKMLLPDIR